MGSYKHLTVESVTIPTQHRAAMRRACAAFNEAREKNGYAGRVTYSDVMRTTEIWPMASRMREEGIFEEVWALYEAALSREIVAETYSKSYRKLCYVRTWARNPDEKPVHIGWCPGAKHTVGVTYSVWCDNVEHGRFTKKAHAEAKAIELVRAQTAARAAKVAAGAAAAA